MEATVLGLGFIVWRVTPPNYGDQREKHVENDMETGRMQWFL